MGFRFPATLEVVIKYKYDNEERIMIKVNSMWMLTKHLVKIKSTYNFKNLNYEIYVRMPSKANDIIQELDE